MPLLVLVSCVGVASSISIIVIALYEHILFMLALPLVAMAYSDMLAKHVFLTSRYAVQRLGRDSAGQWFLVRHGTRSAATLLYANYINRVFLVLQFSEPGRQRRLTPVIIFPGSIDRRAYRRLVVQLRAN